MSTVSTATIADLRELVVHGLCDGGGLGLREARSEALSMSSDDLTALDAQIIESVMVDDLHPGVFADDDSQPLHHWWWHLGKIRDKTFPADLLPADLRSVYLNTEKS